MADREFLYWAARCERDHAIPVMHFQAINPNPSWPKEIPLTCPECKASDIYLPGELEVVEFPAAIPKEKLPKLGKLMP
jgi:hypothetical protein